MRLFLLLTLPACTYTFQVVDVHDAGEVTGPDYIIVRGQANGNEKVYDCYSKPDGGQWDPTCVKVEMRSESKK